MVSPGKLAVIGSRVELYAEVIKGEVVQLMGAFFKDFNIYNLLSHDALY